MLHNEARKLLIQALERSHNVREVARNYSVNRSTVYRLKKRLDETGSIETRTYLRGRKPALTSEEVENINQPVKSQTGHNNAGDHLRPFTLPSAMKLFEKQFGNWVIAVRRKLFMPVNRSVRNRPVRARSQKDKRHPTRNRGKRSINFRQA